MERGESHRSYLQVIERAGVLFGVVLCDDWLQHSPRDRTTARPHDRTTTARPHDRTMLDSIKSFFSKNIEQPVETGSEVSSDPIAVAACALMLEIAHADDEFSESERDHIDSAIGRHFGLDDGQVREIISLAEKERRGAVDLFQFTRLISESFDLSQKMVLVEALWGLVFADGEVAKHETYLLRRISKLLDIEPGYLTQARSKVEERHSGGG